jgi:hypothetical protein
MFEDIKRQQAENLKNAYGRANAKVADPVVALKLNEETGVDLEACKAALSRFNGDYESAKAHVLSIKR